MLRSTEYEAAKFFIHHANQISVLQERLFGDLGPLEWNWEDARRRLVVANDPRLLQLLKEAHEALKGEFTRVSRMLAYGGQA